MGVTVKLLILKSGEGYIRLKSDGYHLCRIEKASVYPLRELSAVKQHARDLRRQGFTDISIRQLILTEMPLEEDA